MEDTGPRFEKGKRYRRREVHDKLGGNRQSGISILKDHKTILLFTSRRGHRSTDTKMDGGAVLHLLRGGSDR